MLYKITSRKEHHEIPHVGQWPHMNKIWFNKLRTCETNVIVIPASEIAQSDWLFTAQHYVVLVSSDVNVIQIIRCWSPDFKHSKTPILKVAI